MESEQPAIRLTVDGEQFEVKASLERAGAYHFAWLSGPNKGYGFGTATSNGSMLSDSQMELSIRDFLAQVDPGTGYIE